MTRNAVTVSIRNGQRPIARLILPVALLLPWHVTAESSLQSGARTASSGATAHLDFKIVIPPVLALSIENPGVAANVAPRVSIFSNTRHVLLTASAALTTDSRAGSGRGGASDAIGPSAGGAAATGATDRAPRTVLLSAARHAVISAESGCLPGGPRPVAIPGHSPGAAIVDLHPVVCTVAMP